MNLSKNPNENENWFNELDEKTIEIINDNLIKEEDFDSDEKECFGNDSIELFDSSNSSNSTNSNSLGNSSDEESESSENIKAVFVEDIIIKNPSTISSNDLLQYECSVSHFIQTLLEDKSSSKIKFQKNNDEPLSLDKMKSILEYLKWISLSCKVLSKRINQEEILFKPEYPPVIVRSSYNFCSKYTQCKKFYSKYELPICTEHHYVHSLLKYDIDSMIYFLDFVINHDSLLTKNEQANFCLSIKTLCFVTKHMSKEISYIHYITKNNSETFHRSNPIEILKKRFNKNKPFDSFKKSVVAEKNDTKKQLKKTNVKQQIVNKQQNSINMFSILNNS